MTPDKTPSPTDAEIDLLISKHWPAFATAGAVPLKALRNAFREGISEWGSPVVAVEPVGWVARAPRIEQTANADWCAYLDVEDADEQQIGVVNICRGITSREMALALVRNWVRDFSPATPQPTQAQAGAVPLTDEQMDAIWEECKFDNGEEWSIDWATAVRAAERLHGIKEGGQHGTE